MLDGLETPSLGWVSESMGSAGVVGSLVRRGGVVPGSLGRLGLEREVSILMELSCVGSCGVEVEGCVEVSSGASSGVGVFALEVGGSPVWLIGSAIEAPVGLDGSV